VQAAADGTYQLRTDVTGLVELQFTGVDHSAHSVPLLLDKQASLRLDVRLQHNQYVRDLSGVKIIGDFSNFSTENGIFFKKRSDGTYGFTLAVSAPIFKYQLAGFERSGRTVNGPLADRYEYDNDGDYRSLLLPQKGKVQIVLDPRKLVRSTVGPVIAFDPQNQWRKTFTEIIDDLSQESAKFKEYVQTAVASGKDGGQAARSYDWAPANTRFEQRLETTTDPLLRQTILATYFMLGGTNKSVTVAKQAIAEVPPTSPLWQLGPPAMRAPFAVAHQDSAGEAYVQRAINEHPSEAVRTFLLFEGLMTATYASRPDKARSYYDRLVSDYPSSPYATMARERFSPDRKVTTGNPLPSFALPSLQDSTTTYSNATFAGKFLLIDFWAVWCKPCINEMRTLHEIYQKYHPKGLEVLSLSFDRARSDVDEFRRTKWPMPWHHVYVAGGFESATAKTFEVLGIPKPILVDGSGTIVATEAELRGENLDKTLARFLGK
jgi:thiol-disulfide isomerase/thioredoxin